MVKYRSSLVVLLNSLTRAMMPIAVVEEHHEALSYWSALGDAEKFAVVHVDAHPDSAVTASYDKLGSGNTFEERMKSFMTSNDVHLLSATLLGQLGAFIWVYPDWDAAGPRHVPDGMGPFIGGWSADDEEAYREAVAANDTRMPRALESYRAGIVQGIASATNLSIQPNLYAVGWAEPKDENAEICRARPCGCYCTFVAKDREWDWKKSPRVVDALASSLWPPPPSAEEWAARLGASLHPPACDYFPLKPEQGRGDHLFPVEECSFQGHAVGLSMSESDAAQLLPRLLRSPHPSRRSSAAETIPAATIPATTIPATAIPATAMPVLLDIDLDFFSVDQSPPPMAVHDIEEVDRLVGMLLGRRQRDDTQLETLVGPMLTRCLTQPPSTAAASTARSRADCMRARVFPTGSFEEELEVRRTRECKGMSADECVNALYGAVDRLAGLTLWENATARAVVRQRGFCLGRSPRTVPVDSRRDSMRLCIGRFVPDTITSAAVAADALYGPTVGRRVARLTDILDALPCEPRHTIVCRSVRDGYTPHSLGSGIEYGVLALMRAKFGWHGRLPITYDPMLLGGPEGWARHEAETSGCGEQEASPACVRETVAEHRQRLQLDLEYPEAVSLPSAALAAARSSTSMPLLMLLLCMPLGLAVVRALPRRGPPAPPIRVEKSEKRMR